MRCTDFASSMQSIGEWDVGFQSNGPPASLPRVFQLPVSQLCRSPLSPVPGLAGGNVAALVARKPLLLTADIGANLSPKLDLLEALGFAPQDATNLQPAPFPNFAVLRFLRSWGLAGGNIAAPVAHKPLLLAAKVGANLSPKLNLLEALGFAPRDAANLLATRSSCISGSTGCFSSPISLLSPVSGLAGWNVAALVARKPFLLTADVGANLSPKLDLLEALGLAPRDAANLQPAPFAPFPNFTVLHFLRSRGLAGGDVAALVAHKPFLLAADIDANLSAKLNLLEALGFAPWDAANLLATRCLDD